MAKDMPSGGGVALDTAIAALQAVGNLVATLAEGLQQSGVPKEVILLALRRYQDANEASVGQPDSRRLLALQVETVREQIGARNS